MKILTLLVALIFLSGCASMERVGKSIKENAHMICGQLTSAECFGVVVVGAALVGSALKKDKDKPSEPAPIQNNKTRLIIDTDLARDSDQDDAQAFIAQMSSLDSLYNVVGVVQTYAEGYSDGKQYTADLLRKLSAVSPLYKQHEVHSKTDSMAFYKAQIEQAHNEGIELEVHVWGSVVSLQRAASSIIGDGNSAYLSNVTVYFIGSSNRKAVPEYSNAWNALRVHSGKFKAIYMDDQGFRGLNRFGDESEITAIHNDIIKSKVGSIYQQYRISPADAYHHRLGFKAGDLALYFYARNKSFRDRLFKAKGANLFIAEGQAAEDAVRNARKTFFDIVRDNVNR